MNGEYMRIWKNAVVLDYKILSLHSPGTAEGKTQNLCDNNRNSADIWTSIYPLLLLHSGTNDEVGSENWFVTCDFMNCSNVTN
jgi:hypothetical protein